MKRTFLYIWFAITFFLVGFQADNWLESMVLEHEDEISTLQAVGTRQFEALLSPSETLEPYPTENWEATWTADANQIATLVATITYTETPHPALTSSSTPTSTITPTRIMPPTPTEDGVPMEPTQEFGTPAPTETWVAGTNTFTPTRTPTEEPIVTATNDPNEGSDWWEGRVTIQYGINVRSCPSTGCAILWKAGLNATLEIWRSTCTVTPSGYPNPNEYMWCRLNDGAAWVAVRSSSTIFVEFVRPKP